MQKAFFIRMTSGPGSLLNFWTCRNQIILPSQAGSRVRRASHFQSFDGQSFVQNRGTNPIPLQAQVNTQSPARFARLLIVAYRNRHRPIAPIERVGRTPRVYLSPCNRRDIIVEERSRVLNGTRPQTEGQTNCIFKTVYRNFFCNPQQIEMALRDICRVQTGIDNNEFGFAGVVSGCENCDNAADLAADRCRPCVAAQNVAAGPNTTLTEDDIEKIMRWYTTGVSFE